MNNAQTEINVLKNLKANLVCKIDKLIEEKEINKKFESIELSKEFFHLSAHISFNNLLNKILIESSEQILFISKNNFKTQYQ